MRIIELDSTDSTNEYCKRVDSGEDLIVIARRQTGGKGTKGRSFVSEEGGLYLTKMTHGGKISARNAFKIMINTSVAVCRTLEAFGINPVIKWANDVLVNGKKICGTLIENTFSGDVITRSIVGCGINVNNVIAPQIKDIAVSMRDISGSTLDLRSVREQFIANLAEDYTIDDYRRYITWLHSPVTLKTEAFECEVIAENITEDGRLIVNSCGNMLEINAGEVSLRL